MNPSSYSKSRRGLAREQNPAWKHDIHVGSIFGRWTVIAPAEGYTKNRQSRWLCRCECLIEKVVASSALRTGKSVSCGCYRNEKSATRCRARLMGRRLDSQGYVHVYVNGRYRREHMVIVESRLGRKLLADETVHHKNGIRSDNTDTNLEIRVRAKHPHGASVEELLEWADELILRYRSHDENTTASKST
jgi:hypothetical protein